MSTTSETIIDSMFNAGAHFGLGRSRRNPSIASYIFTTKNNTDIFDLEKTSETLKAAKTYVESLAKENKKKLVSDREKGELTKYTKRERMLIDKEIAKLEKMFFGIVSLKRMPDAIFVIDPLKEKNAVAEAVFAKIPTIALCGSDCDISGVTYPILGNDGSKTSIQFFVDEIKKSYLASKIA
ncbi:MAG: 30S ribosomal protein S2 [Candidatus Taylorbacteria bacterium]|nr:30S ribosomal protein S2 [Candidatus Taylorbacteria bacterium]